MKIKLPVLVLIVIFIVNFILLVTTHVHWNNSMNRYIPLKHHISKLDNSLSTGHLWLEEAISGDTSVNIETDVINLLENKDFHKYVKDAALLFKNTEDEVFTKDLFAIGFKLNIFYVDAKKRLENTKYYEIGSAVDQKFDSDFNTIKSMIQTLSQNINIKLSNELEEKNNYFILILILFLLVNIVALSMLMISRKREDKKSKSLYQEKEKAIVTLSSIGDAVVTTDKYGNITFINKITEKLTELTNEEVKGLHIDKVLNLTDMKSGKKILTPISDVLYNNLTKLISNETKLISKTGIEYVISDSAAPIKNKNNEIIGTVLVFQNDTKNYQIKEELQKTYETNKKLNERMKLALIGNKDGLWDWNLLTDEVYFSPRWKEILGYSDDELSNTFFTWKSKVHPDDLDKVLKGIQENIDAKSDYYEGVHRLKHKDGFWVWILNRGKTIFDENSKAIRMSGTHTDITKQKEQELKYIERGNILENSLNEIYIFDSITYKFLYINKGARKNIGYTLQEILKMTPFDIKPEFTKEEFIDIIKPLIKNIDENISFSTVYQRKDGTKYNVDIYLQKTIFEKHNAYVAIILDITKRKKAEAKLKEQHKYLQSIVDGINDPIMVIKENHTIELMNEDFKKSIDYLKIADPQYPKCYEVIYNRTIPCDIPDYDCPLKHVLKTNKHCTIIHKHETNFVELSASPLFDKNKNCVGVIQSSRDITRHLKIQDELREQKNILDHQAHHDSLTGLPNRVLFNDRLEQAIETAKRNKTNLALLFIDLDHFKEINDSLGHDFGDKILKIVTTRLNEVIRKEDTIARLGGDEFTVILEDLIQVQDASFISNKILESLAKVININDTTLYVSSSIGISIYPDDGKSSQNLLKFADSAMYKAKDEGRNNFQYYNSSMTELAFERVVMEASLRSAIENEEFEVYYQPQVNGATDKIIGMEALVRWNHPTMGLVSPSKFIPLAESTGLIVELDRYVMKIAMKHIVQWYEDGLNPGVLAMNLALKQLQQKDFIDIFKELMKKTKCKAEWLELEATEGQIMIKPEESIKKLQNIRDLGIELAVDDFGTGYSSLTYLKRLPINKLKIDKAFVRDLPDDEEDAGITKAVIALAKSLNLKIIAEGVETKEQKDFIIENGCDNIQGFYYSKPLPAKEFELILKNGL